MVSVLAGDSDFDPVSVLVSVFTSDLPSFDVASEPDLPESDLPVGVSFLTEVL